MSLKTATAMTFEQSARPAPEARKPALGGVSYSPETFEEHCASVSKWFLGGGTGTFTAGYVNPHVFNMAVKNAALRRFLQRADIAAVDGLGVALAVRLLRGTPQTRTVMTPLFDWALAQPDFPGVPAVLIGGDSNVLRLGAQAINKTSRNLQVTASRTGYESVREYLELLEQTPDAKVVLVAMGSPRSEEFILTAMDSHPGRFYWNIGGGTLHFYAGTQPRVPLLVSRTGLQWAWRIVHEPSIAPRYFLGIPLFLKHLLGIALTRNNPTPASQ